MILRPLFALAAVAAAALPADRLRVLIVTGSSDALYHDWRVTTPFLKGKLEDTGRFTVEVAAAPQRLTAEVLGGADVIVLNYNGPRWGPAAEKAVEDSLRSGKGMIAVHGVSYGAFFGMEWTGRRWAQSREDKGWEAYPAMLGATWKLENIGHARRHVFQVKWVDRDHPISRGLEPTFSADDELYHRMDLRSNAHVLAAAYSDPAERGTGKEEPLIWTIPFGRGRVVHVTLGHDVKAMSGAGFIAAFTRGIEWAATGSVTLSVPSGKD